MTVRNEFLEVFVDWFRIREETSSINAEFRVEREVFRFDISFYLCRRMTFEGTIHTKPLLCFKFVNTANMAVQILMDVKVFAADINLSFIC